MLSDVFDQNERALFLAKTYRKTAMAMPDRARNAGWLVDWERFGELALIVPPEDVLVVGNGRLFEHVVPTPDVPARAILSTGRSVVLRAAERFDRSLSDLAQALHDDVGGVVAVQLYGTPAGSHSFGWHYDYEDVFIVQCEGEKEYLLRENTVNPRPRHDAMPRDMQFERETTQAIACTLERGDWLYIPAGWWHVAFARTDSLSISAGAYAEQTWRH